ncbi:MAG: NINE protein, partial [Candidatus Saccharibacteria bacterium]|nr:NINE protein [Candidatus Saccharibacteria bacterium]
MENQADNSVTPKTNNTMSTADHKTSQFSDSRITAAAIFAFLPNFGIIGVHNFILKQYKRGIAHIVIVIVCYVPYFIASALCNHNCYNVIFSTVLLQYLAVVSYIWAIVEGVQILQLKKQKTSPLPVED